MTSEAVGEVEKEGNVLVVRRIHVTYCLRLALENKEAALRVHAIHAERCPMARTIRGCVAITTALEMEDLAQDREPPG